jgi:hypothetical protein
MILNISSTNEEIFRFLWNNGGHHQVREGLSLVSILKHKVRYTVFSSPILTSSLLASTILFGKISTNAFRTRFFLSTRDKVSYQYHATDTLIIFLYLYLYMFSQRTVRQKHSELSDGHSMF